MPGRILVVPELFKADEPFLRAFAAAGEADYALFATRSLLERWQSELLRLLPGHALGSHRLLLFPGLARLLLGPGAARPLSAAACEAVMAMVIERLRREGKLKALAPAVDISALARGALTALGELRRGMVPRHRLAEAGRSRQPLADLAACWQGYEQALSAAGVFDADALLERALAAVPGTGAQAMRSILVHGFTDMSPLQAGLLRKLAGAGCEVTLLLPDPGQLKPISELHEAICAQFTAWPVEGPGAALKPAAPKTEAAQPQAFELAAEGETALATLLAREIRANLRADRTLQLHEIALIEREAAAASSLHQALKRRGLPLAEASGPPLSGLNSVGMLLAALQCVAEDWPRAAVLRLARGVLVREEAPLADALARLSARMGVVRTRAAWQELLAFETGTEGDGPVSRAAEKALAAAAVERLSAGLALIPAQADLSTYLGSLREFVAYWGLAERWWPAEAKADILAAYACEWQGLHQLLSLLEDMARAEGLAGAVRAWGAGALGAELGRLAARTFLPAAPGQAGIRCLGPSEARGLRFRLVFLVGLAEGEFPKTLGETWLLPEEVHGRLSSPGYGLESRAVLAKREWRLLANAIAAAGERLYFCWSTLDGTGEARTASPFLGYVRERFAPAAITLGATELLPRTAGEAWNEASARARLLADLLWHELPAELLPGLLGAYEMRRHQLAGLMARAGLEKSRRVGSGAAAGRLEEEAIIAHLAARFGPEHVFGVSALDDYAACPFLFFVRHILGVEPLRAPIEEPSGLDLGLAYHAILEGFFRRHGKTPLQRERRREYEQALRQEIAAAFAPMRQRAHTAATKSLVAMGEQLCRQRLLSLLDKEIRLAAKTGGWRVGHVELGFGVSRSGLDPASRTEPLLLTDGASPIRVAGKIDRVDLSPAGYIIYDYKLNKVPELKLLLMGGCLQIPLYLLAARRCFFPGQEAVGAAYYNLRDLSRKTGFWRADLQRLTGISARTGGSLDGPAWEQAMAQAENRVMEAVRGIRAGDFQPTAAECPAYCQMGKVCRKEAL